MRFGLRELVFLTVLLGIPVAAYFLVFQPRNTQIANARDEICTKENRLAEARKVTAGITDLDEEIKKLKDAIVLLEKRLPQQRETEVILKEVWELAVKHRLSPKKVSGEQPVVAAHYTELPIRLEIVGNFDGFYSFLLDLEKLRRITRIPKMEMKKIVSDQGHMQAELVLSIFFQQEPGAAPYDVPSGRSRL